MARRREKGALGSVGPIGLVAGVDQLNAVDGEDVGSSYAFLRM
jgi:hypothetical protein